jgi:hypothetical protein
MGLIVLVLAFTGGLAAQASGQAPGNGGRTPDPPGFTDQAVDQAIKQAVKYIWSQYDAKNCLWPPDEIYPRDINDRREWGNYTCLAMYALLAAGEKTDDPRILATYDWVSKIDMRSTYALGLRCQVHTFMLRNMKVKAAARANLLKDADRVVKSMYHPVNWSIGTAAWEGDWGMWGYICDGLKGGPHPNNQDTQFGILGIEASLTANAETKPIIWELIFNHYKKYQNPDGGWGYENHDTAGSTGPMTAASLAGAFLSFYYLHAEDFIKVGNKAVNADYPTLHKGLQWFEKNFDSPGVAARDECYYWYCVQRLGMVSGYKYLGGKDWYKAIASRLIATQTADGSWGNRLEDTAFALLALHRGDYPVLFNHLDYKTGDWNNRPMSMYYLTRWVENMSCGGSYNWQIVDLQTEPEDWHDAPILLLTGSQDFKLQDADLDKLRRFAQEGGTIFSIAEGKADGAKFDAAMREYYKKLFPDYELALLPKEHKIYATYDKIARPMPIYALSNGVRNLAYHTAEDLPREWQTNSYSSGREQFQIVMNMLFYANGERWNFPRRGMSHWPVAKAAAGTAKIQRVKFDGNWNPEPMAWPRFGILMGNAYQVRVDALPGVTADKLDVAASKVATLTGTGKLVLSEAEKAGLKAYVQAGGTLIVDAGGPLIADGTGGSKEFADTAAKLLEEVFGAAPELLPDDSPVYLLGGKPLEKVQYSRATRERYGPELVKGRRLMGIKDGERIAVFFSPLDITSGLLGCGIADCVGYEPDTSFNLMRNMVAYGLGLKLVEPTTTPPAASTSQPTTAPLGGK